jgi:hypothetical protein
MEFVRSDDEKALVRKVRKQFEVLRPRTEVLKARPDGDDLDLDAVVRMRADLAAGGEGGIASTSCHGCGAMIWPSSTARSGMRISIDHCGIRCRFPQ